MMIHGVPGPLSRDDAPLLAQLVGLGLIQAVSLVAVALVIQTIVSGVITAGENGIDLTLLSLLVAVACTGPLARWLERINAERLGNRCVHRVRLVLFDALTKGRPSSGARDRQRGVHMVRFSNDLTAIRQWVSLGLSRLIGSTLFLAGVLAAIALIDIRMAALATVVLVLALAATLAIGIGFEKSVRVTRRRRGRIANSVAETLANSGMLEDFGRTGRERRRLERLSEELGDALKARGFWIGLLRAFTDFSHRTIMIAVLLAGAMLLATGTLSVGGLLAVTGVTAMLGGPLRDLGRVFEYWKSARVAAEKLNQTIDARPVVRGPRRRLRSGGGKVSIEDLAIDGLFACHKLQCPQGSRVAITGVNGSGKTTLLRLISGLAKPDRGRVRLDGVDTRRLSANDRREAIGLASSRVPLVSGSISKNIRYRRPSADTACVLQAVQDAGLESLLHSFERGISTSLGYGGKGLSGGEAARVKIARAVLDKPRLLLLDEIESGLDSDGRAALMEILRSYTGTVIYATHDVEFVNMADQLWHIAQGEVAATRPFAREQAIASA